MERRRQFRSLMSLGIVAALVGAVALASSGVQQPAKVCAQAPQCHYTQMANGAQELGYTSPTGTFVRPDQTATLEFNGPYQGTLVISPEAETAIGTAEDVTCASDGQDVTLEKGSGTLTFYAKNCGTIPDEIRFNVDMVDECRRPAQRTEFSVNINDGQQTYNSQCQTQQQQCNCQPQNGGGNTGGGSNTGGGNTGGGNTGGGNTGGGNTGGGNTGGGNTGGGSWSPGSFAGGQNYDGTCTDAGYAGMRDAPFAYSGAYERGPYQFQVGWSWAECEPEIGLYRVHVEHDDTQELPDGVGALRKKVWEADTPGDVLTRIMIGGQGVSGFGPGVTFKVRLEAVPVGETSGTMSDTVTVTTYETAELGAVGNIRLLPYSSGDLGLIWDHAPGMDDSSHRNIDVQYYSVEQRGAGGSYAHYKDTTRERVGLPQTAAGTELCFRVTAKRRGLSDGTPAEKCVTVPEITQIPPALTITKTLQIYSDKVGFHFSHKPPPDVYNVKAELIFENGDTVSKEARSIMGAFRGYTGVRVALDGRAFCIRIAAVIGDGPRRVDGEFSAPRCHKMPTPTAWQ